MIGGGWGGVEAFFRDCCIEMSKRRHRILAVVRKKSQLHDAISSYYEYVEVETVGNRFGNYDLLSVLEITRILKKFNPDIVVSHNPRTALFTNKSKPADTRAWPHVSFVPNRLRQKYYQGTDMIIPHTKSQATTDYHVDLVEPKFSEVIPLFTSTEPVERIRPISTIRNIFAAGRLQRVKGFNHLLDAICGLSNIGCDVKLTVAGDGPELNNLLQQREKLNLEKLVDFSGFSENVIEQMKQADLFVLPSVSEPFGIVLLEAMALCIPIVTTKTNGPLEIFDNSSAVLVDVGSARALRKGMQIAIQDPESTMQRSSKALEIFKTRYSPDAVVPRLIKVFKQCIDHHNATKPT